MNRRFLIQSLLASTAIASCPAFALGFEAATSFVLANGLKVTFVKTPSQFVNATLILRSARIYRDGGLGHIVEHTSFVGAAGHWSADEVKSAQQDLIQEINAVTQPGMIRWDACFLPESLDAAIELLAVTSLDQKFDVDTVASEARVVLQELYLDKYSSSVQADRQVSIALFGGDHPIAYDSTPDEIAKASLAPERLAAELRAYAAHLKLPGNMELFVVGDVDAAALRDLSARHFGKYAAASGPMLSIPSVHPTRAFKTLKATSGELAAPLSKLTLAWNTGVSVADRDAGTLVALFDYLNRKLMERLREEYGDSYSPEAVYEPDGCSGVVTISVETSTKPEKVEQRIIETFDMMKNAIDAKELARFKARQELKRRRNAENNEAIVDRLVERVTEGVAIADLHPERATAEELVLAARKFLPGLGQGYVRLIVAGEPGGRIVNTSGR